jgi:hypothetical protein
MSEGIEPRVALLEGKVEKLGDLLTDQLRQDAEFRSELERSILLVTHSLEKVSNRLDEWTTKMDGPLKEFQQKEAAWLYLEKIEKRKKWIWGTVAVVYALLTNDQFRAFVVGVLK